MVDHKLSICTKKILSESHYPEANLKFLTYIKGFCSASGENYTSTFPYKLFLKLTSRCNLRCKHCYFIDDESKFDESTDLSFERIKELINEISEINVCNLILTGGEIFTRKDIIDIIKICKLRNIPISLSTNACLITEEIAKSLSEILNCQTDNIQISIDGAGPETHDLSRGHGNFSRTIKATKFLLKYDLPVSFNTVITSDNIFEILDIYELAANLKIKKISFSKLAIIKNQHEQKIVDMQTIIDQLYKAIKLSQKSKKTFIEILGFDICDLLNVQGTERYIDELLLKIPIAQAYECSCNKDSRAHIDSNGDVYLCHIVANNSEYSIGNIKNKSFKDIWSQRDSNIFFQSKPSTVMLCKKCKYVRLCRGGCPYYTQEAYGTLLYPTPNCNIGKKIIEDACGESKLL